MTTETRSKTPWYRQFFPWLLIAILTWGIVSSLITLSVAVGNPPQMMTGDYQRLGKLMVDTHERADRAEALGLGGRLQLQGDLWRLDLQSNEPLDHPSLLLRVQHPTDTARDRQFVLRFAPGSGWTAPVDDRSALPVRGRLIVSDLVQSWWISGTYQQQDALPLEIALAPERL